VCVCTVRRPIETIHLIYLVSCVYPLPPPTPYPPATRRSSLCRGRGGRIVDGGGAVEGHCAWGLTWRGDDGAQYTGSCAGGEGTSVSAGSGARAFPPETDVRRARGGLKTISGVDKLDLSCARARGKKLPITDDNADE